VVDPVVAVDDGTVTYANAAARDAFGIGDADRDAATALGTRWDRLAAAIDETTVGTARRIDLEGDAGGVRIHRGADGATITFDRSVVGSQTDADETDGSLAEGSLADASDRLVKDRALAAAPVGVTISDPDREDNPLVYVNEAYQEITGYEFDEVVGRNCRFLQGPESDEDTIAEMAAAIDEKRPVTVELKNYRKDGTEFWNEGDDRPRPRRERPRDQLRRLPERRHCTQGSGTRARGADCGTRVHPRSRRGTDSGRHRRRRRVDRSLDARVRGLCPDRGRRRLRGAWIGERNPATGAINVRSSAETDPDRDAIEMDDHPAAATLATGEPTVGTIEGRLTPRSR